MINEMNISRAYDLWSETYNGFAKWSDEDRADWISNATHDGFTTEEAGEFYDQVKSEAQ